MACITVPTALAIAGSVSAGSSVIGGALSSGAAKSAASTQAAASENAAQLQYSAEQQALAFQQQQYGISQAELAPYMNAGVSALNNLAGPGGALGALTQNQLTPYSQTAIQAGNTFQLPQNLAQLAQTPGYQFTLQQGLEATQNGFAAQGLGRSGAALKGAANYAEGLAGTTYQNQFQNYLNANTLQGQLQGTTNQQQLQLGQAQIGQNLQIYNMLAGLTQTGAQAALGQGQIGTTLTGQTTQALQAGATGIGQGITGAAAAQAAGTVGSTNAITNALGGIGGAGNNTALLLALNQAGMFGGGVPTNTPGSPFDSVGTYVAA